MDSDNAGQKPLEVFEKGPMGDVRRLLKIAGKFVLALKSPAHWWCFLAKHVIISKLASSQSGFRMSSGCVVSPANSGRKLRLPTGGGTTAPIGRSFARCVKKKKPGVTWLLVWIVSEEICNSIAHLGRLLFLSIFDGRMPVGPRAQDDRTETAALLLLCSIACA